MFRSPHIIEWKPVDDLLIDYASAKINNSLEIHWSVNNIALELCHTRTQGCTSGAVNCSMHAVIPLRTIIIICPIQIFHIPSCFSLCKVNTLSSLSSGLCASRWLCTGLSSLTSISVFTSVFYLHVLMKIISDLLRRITANNILRVDLIASTVYKNCNSQVACNWAMK